MGFDDSDIILRSADQGIRFTSILPQTGSQYMYMKVLKNGKIVATSGDYIKDIFNLNKSKLKYKSIASMKYSIFKNFIHDIIIKNPKKAIQFSFNYKDHITAYTCSVYPCLVDNEPDTYDVVIRENLEQKTPFRFHTIL